MVERLLRRDVPSAAPDHQRQLALEVEMRRHRRTDQRGLMADQRIGEPDEHAGLLRQVAPGLGGMGAIVDAGAKNLLRVRDGRQPRDLAQAVVGLRACGDLRDLAQRIRRQRLAQPGKAAAQPLVQGDNAVAGHHAEAGLAARDIARQFHPRPPRRAFCNAARRCRHWHDRL